MADLATDLNQVKAGAGAAATSRPFSKTTQSTGRPSKDQDSQVDQARQSDRNKKMTTQPSPVWRGLVRRESQPILDSPILTTPTACLFNKERQ